MNLSHDEMVALLVGYMSQLPKSNACGQVYATLHAVTDALQLVADPLVKNEKDDRFVAYVAAGLLEETMNEVQDLVEGP